MFPAIANAHSIVQHSIVKIKNGIMNHINVSVKIILRAQKIKVGILTQVFVIMVRI